jgi:hypothetical protein
MGAAWLTDKKLYKSNLFICIPFIFLISDYVIWNTIGYNRFFNAPFNQWWQFLVDSPLLICGVATGLLGITNTKGSKRLLIILGTLICILFLLFLIMLTLDKSSPNYDWGA